MYFLYYFKLGFKLELKSKLELELPYRVIKVELLAVVAGDAACYMQCYGRFKYDVTTT